MTNFTLRCTGNAYPAPHYPHSPPIGTPTWFLHICTFTTRNTYGADYSGLGAHHSAASLSKAHARWETWLYNLLQGSQSSHATAVVALYYLSLLTYQLTREGKTLRPCDQFAQCFTVKTAATARNTYQNVQGQRSGRQVTCNTRINLKGASRRRSSSLSAMGMATPTTLPASRMTDQRSPLPNSSALAEADSDYETESPSHGVPAQCPHCMFTACLMVAKQQFEGTQDGAGLSRDFIAIAQSANVPVRTVMVGTAYVLTRLRDRLAVDVGTMNTLLAAYTKDPVRIAWWAQADSSTGTEDKTGIERPSASLQRAPRAPSNMDDA